jgi:biotin transporter BioY
MSTISKPDANPIVALLLTWFVLGLGHFLINGQQKKWIFTLVATFIGFILCYLPGLIIMIMSIADSYMTAKRLQSGEEIGEHEYSLPMLYKVCKIMHKEATCSAAVEA